MCGLAEAVGSGLGLYGVQHTKGLQVFSRLIERSGLGLLCVGSLPGCP